MNRSILMLALVLMAAPVQAQVLSPAWEAYRKQQRQAGQPAAPATTPALPAENEPLTVSPSGYSGAAPVPTVPRPTYAQAQRLRRDGNRSAAFVGVQAGKGWIYEDVDQQAWGLSAGYRWRAGPIAQVGIEAATGRLDDTRHDGWYFPRVRYTSLGATARFNFGRHNPWHGIVRSGIWTANARDAYGYRENVDGAYASFGVGVDVNRHLNLSLVYTAFVYLDDYDGYYDYEDVNRADQLSLGLEVRF
jgi:hypothetical protein